MTDNLFQNGQCVSEVMPKMKTPQAAWAEVISLLLLLFSHCCVWLENLALFFPPISKIQPNESVSHAVFKRCVYLI